MATKTKDQKRAAALLKALTEQGRTVSWLAEATGYSRPYVSNVLHAKVPWSSEFASKAASALAEASRVTVTYRGRAISIPENIYKGAADLPLVVVESAYEEAWKKAWLQEHAVPTLAAAAERAWQVEQSNLAA